MVYVIGMVRFCVWFGSVYGICYMHSFHMSHPLGVQIKPFRPRRMIHVCKITPFAPVGFHVCCPELRQEPAQLRVLRKRNSSGKASSDAGPELAGRES